MKFIAKHEMSVIITMNNFRGLDYTKSGSSLTNGPFSIFVVKQWIIVSAIVPESL